MPRINRTPDPLIEDALAEWAEFESPSAWKRSRKGNLWRRWNGLNVTVFKRDDGYFGWSIANEEGPRYSPGRFETEGEAMNALGSNLGVGL